MSSRLCMILVLYLKILNVACKGNSSLTFVIDDTSSMRDDIKEVICGSHDILDFVLETKSSEIQDLILVTFNDPGVAIKEKTKSKTKFIRALERIRVHGGGDCPEYSMKGIIEALDISRPDSYLYVFTDAYAKDFHRVGEVINLCERKQSQVIFVLTGNCRRWNNDDGYNVYHEIAKACSGSVIEIDTREVHLAVDMIKTIVDDKKTIITRTSVKPDVSDFFGSSPVPFTLDEKTEYAIITVSGADVRFNIRRSNDFHEPIVPTEPIMSSRNFKVVKLVNDYPGTYTAWVKGKGEVSIVIYGKTDLTFEYGFSDFVPKSPVDTSKQPIDGKEHYLSVSVRDPEHEIDIQTAAILSTDEKVLMEFPLKRIATDFYVTDHFLPPNTTFKIAVNGIIRKTGKLINRVSKISVTPRLPEPKIPNVKILEGTLIKVDYGSNISLTCEVSGYPKPKIQWQDSDGNMFFDTQSSMIEFPYKYVSNLKVNHTGKSKSYICKASNNLGAKISSIHVHVQSPLSRIITLPATTIAEYGKDLTLKCFIYSKYPTETKWYFHGPRDKISPSADGSGLTIKDMDMNYEGQYTCKVTLKGNTAFSEMQRTQVKVIDLARPEVTLDSGKITVFEKSKAIISCRIVKGTPRPKISWKFMKKDGSESNIVNESSEDLTINSVSLKNSGKYECTATNDFGKTSAVADLEVLKSPEIINDRASHALVPYDGEHMFTCRGVAYPAPTIIWKDEVGRIVQSTTVYANENEFTSQLYLKHIKENGTYTCSAQNSNGKSQQQFAVSVNSPFKHDSKLNVVKEVKYGEEIKLKCDVSSDFAVERNWIVNKSKELIKTDKKYSLIQDANELVIKSMDINSQGTYICKVKLEEDPNVFVEKKITLILNNLASPKLTASKEILNKTFIARCLITNGVPQPVVTWKFKGDTGVFTDLGIGGETLIINNIQRQHNGSYQCIGKNAIGTDSAILSLDIGESPKIITDKTEYRGVVGDKVLVIPCHVTGYPDPTIVWKNNKNEIIETGSKYIIKGNSNSQSLSILNPTKSDTGNLICEATNKVGTSAKTFNVFVVADVIDHLGNKHFVYLLEKESKDIECTLPDSDSHSLRWYKNLTDLTNVTGITYSIKNADVSHDGYYTCRANTDIGSVSETFVVDVGYKPVFENDEPVTWFGDQNDLIDCTVRAKPAAKVEWFINGKKTNNEEFEQRVLGWGNYTCKVNNVHGVAVKTSIVTTPGCLINRTIEEKNNPPFILNTNNGVDSEEPALNNNEYMMIESGQIMKLTCYKPGNNTFNLFPEKDTILAECYKEDKFISDGKTYKYSDLKCEKPLVPVMRDTNKKCINDNSTVIKLGFEVPNFVEAYEICYDNKRSLPNYGYSTLSRQNLGNRGKTWTGRSPYEAVKGINYCGDEFRCCYGKGQLVNAADVDIGPPQMTPFIDLNAITVWKPCTKENRTTWRNLEENVRSLLLHGTIGTSIKVWSGASEYEKVNVRRVPRYLWKVLKANDEIIAVVVYINTQEPKPEDIKCKKPEQIQNRTMKSEELEIGDDPYTYLCSLEDFSKAFDVPIDTL